MRHLSFRPVQMVSAIALTAVLAACTAQPPAQYLLDVPTSTLRLSPLVSSVEVRTVSLPRYATADGLTRQGEDAALTTDSSEVWADNPERAATLAIARNLGAITSARVSAEPWPFAQPPAAMVTITVEQFVATAANTVRLQGDYAIAPVASGLADRGGRFDISAPITGEDAQAFARAHGQALLQLSQTIAQRLAR